MGQTYVMCPSCLTEDAGASIPDEDKGWYWWCTKCGRRGKTKATEKDAIKSFQSKEAWGSKYGEK